MENIAPKVYPGSDATIKGTLLLADEYQRAAIFILQQRQKNRAITSAPGRLLAIHAIELYLNAYLQQLGFAAEKIRTFCHDLSEILEQVRDAEMLLGQTKNGLNLSEKTERHLIELVKGREYLATRYAADLMQRSFGESPQNRLLNTLAEVASKTRNAIGN